MRKMVYAALAAAAILVLAAPAKPATAMPIASPAAIGATAAQTGTVTQAHYWRWHHRHWAWRRHHYWAWHGPYWYPRYYWFSYPQPYWHAYGWGPYWGWGWHRSWWM
jgi:hypothetical protein